MIKKGDTIPGIVTTTFGAIAWFYILGNSKMPILAENANGVLGSGFYPFISALMLMILGIALIIRGIKQHGTVDYYEMTAEKKENLKTVGLMTLAIALLLIAWKLTEQFIICLFIYALAINFLLKRSKKFTLIFAVVATAFVFVLFCLGFSIMFRP